MTDERVEQAKSILSQGDEQRQGTSRYELPERDNRVGTTEQGDPKFTTISARDTQLVGIRRYKESPRSGQYDRLASEAKAIFEDRNAIYKDAFVMLGLIGTVSTLVGDTQRLKNMIYLSTDHGRSQKENIKDKLIDVINQGIISLMMLEEENYEGK